MFRKFTFLFLAALFIAGFAVSQVFAATALFSDSYETSSIGSIPIGWSLPYPGTQHYVTDSTASDGSQSFFLQGSPYNGAALVRDLTSLNIQPGILRISYWLKPDIALWTGNDGDVKVQFWFNNQEVHIGLRRVSGVDKFVINAEVYDIPSTFDKNNWNKFSIVFDTFNGTAKYYVNDQYFSEASARYLERSDQIYINSGNAGPGGGRPSAYYDDFTIEEVDSLENGLVAYYPFNGNANDESGNGNEGTVYGAQLTDDRFGNSESAYYFDGNADRINVPHDSVQNTELLTVSMWVKPDPIQNQGWIHLVWKNTVGGADGFSCLLYPDNRPYATIGGYSPDRWIFTSTALAANEWNHVVFQYDGTNNKIFINGELDTITSNNSSITPSSRPMQIGGAAYNDQYSFRGILDDIKVYSWALSENEIQELYSEESAFTKEKIVFAGKAPSGFNDLWMMNPDGTDLVQLTDEAKDGINSDFPNIFPDGKRILYIRDANIHILDLATLTSTPVTTDGAKYSYQYYGPNLSPDGTKIVYIYMLHAPGSCSSCTTWEVWIMDINGQNKERITSNSYRDAGVIFSPDGTKLLITHYQGAPSSDCCNQTDIYIYDLLTKTETRLYGTYGYDWGEDWSVGGIAFRESDPNYTVSLINPDGSGYTKLFATNVGPYSKYSSDGSKLFYLADSSGAKQWDGYIYDFSTETSTRITEGIVLANTDRGADWGFVADGCPDADNDGYTTCGGDADDGDPTTCPGAPELCDGKDNNQDDQVDEGNPGGGDYCTTGEPGACSEGITECAAGSIICIQSHSPAAELCEGLDNDCDGIVDEDFTDLGDACTEGIGECAADGSKVCSGDGAGTVCDAVPGAPLPELCDGLDNDCDGATDEDDLGTPLNQSCYSGPPVTLGVGVCQGGTLTCVDGSYGSCDGEVLPTTETCDNLDNDCDGTADDEWILGGIVTFSDLNGTSGLVKGDSCGTGVCEDGTVICSGDGVDLTCSTEWKAVTETCDTLDNDCDGLTDDADPDVSAQSTWYKDGDGDGHSDGNSLVQCFQPAGYFLAADLLSVEGDCNDSDSAINPGADETCDLIDNDCDDLVDDSDPGIIGQTTWYSDVDRDLYSDGSILTQCFQPAGYFLGPDLTALNGDCDDGQPLAYPGFYDVCDSIDNDCSGIVDDGDADGDGVTECQDACLAEDATGFDADSNGCIDNTGGLVEVIDTLLDGGVIEPEMENSIITQVENAQKSADKDKICTAENQLQAFKNHVDAQRGDKISEEAADLLLAYADNIIAQLLAELPIGETCN